MIFFYTLFQFVVECHAQTLLPQYLGMYRLTVNDVETYVVVMRNVFSPRLNIHKKYDLKVKVFWTSYFNKLKCRIFIFILYFVHFLKVVLKWTFATGSDTALHSILCC